MLIDRRTVLSLAASFVAAPALAQAGGMTRATAYAFSFRGLRDGSVRLSDYMGKPILIVNTASLCGYTPQYAGLQNLWTRYRDRGLMVIGVPSNDFGGQEPGGETEISHTARQYDVDFPIVAKTSVKGDSSHPFYRWAAIERPLDTPRWNFHKYLVGRDGHIAAVFASAVEASDPRIVEAIEKELGASG